MEDPMTLQFVHAETASAKDYEQDESDEEGSLSVLEKSGVLVSVQESGLLEDGKALNGRIHSASSQGEMNRAGTTTPKAPLMKSSENENALPDASRQVLFSASEIEDTSSPQPPVIKASVVIKQASDQFNQESKALKPVSRSATRGQRAPRAKSSKPRIDSKINFSLAPTSSTPSVSNLQHRPSRILRPTVPMQRVIGSDNQKAVSSELPNTMMNGKDMGTQMDVSFAITEDQILWKTALESVSNVLYLSRKAIYDPKKRSFTLKYERNPGSDHPLELCGRPAVPKLRLKKALTLMTPASSQILKSSVGTKSSRSVEPQYSKSVLPEIFRTETAYASNWAINFAHKSELEIEDNIRSNSLMLENLRRAAVTEPHARPHTHMSPRLRRRHLERAKTANQKPNEDDDCPINEKGTSANETDDSQQRHFELLQENRTNKAIKSEDMRSQHYSDVSRVVEQMKKAMPARSLPIGAAKRIAPKSTKATIAGKPTCLHHLNPPHEQFLKDLSYSKSIFEQTSDSLETNIRHYFTT